MQCSIFSNTVYKNRTSLVRLGFPCEGGTPSVKHRQASCIFKTATFQSILMVQKLLRADSIIAHIKEEDRQKKKKTEEEEGKKKVCLSTRRSQCRILLRFSCFPGIQMAAPSCSSVQLCLTDVRKMSNLSRCLMPR